MRKRRRTDPQRFLVIGLLVYAVWMVDAMLPQGIAAGVLYLGPVSLSFLLVGRVAGVAMATVSTALVFLGLLIAPWPPQAAIWVVLANRLLSVLVIFLAAAVSVRLLKARERVSRAAQGGHQATIDSPADAVVTVDGQGRIVDVNPAAERMFGYGRSEVLGKPVEHLISMRFSERHV